MRHYKVAVIPGDGIGKEVVPVGLQVLDQVASQHGFSLEKKFFPFGGEHYLKTGETLPDAALAELRGFHTIFLGAVGMPAVKPGILEKGVLLKLRFELDQYINLRPVKLYPGLECPIKGKTSKDLDYIVVRENSGDVYTGMGGISQKGTPMEVALQVMSYNYAQVERCLRYAFETARARPRKILALIGKSNVLTHVFDLWDRVFHEMGQKEFPEVKREYYHVDAACIYMISSPERFDVMVTTNMFGDILTDLGAVTQGGIGMAASGNLDPSRRSPSMFEPIHGSAPDIAGQNKANPIATVMSAKMMLDFLGEKAAAAQVDKAITTVTTQGFAGQGTKEIGARLLAAL
jgi:3-isopropylmalate dehydrogenase